MPFRQIQEWLNKEKELGSSTPDRAVLATAAKNGPAHSRVIVVREVAEEGVLFFTQKGTRKVKEILDNPQASMTFWLAFQQRQIIIEGTIVPLAQSENEAYWRSLPRERQLRFSAYAPTSGQPLHSLEILDKIYQELEAQYQGKDIPMCEFYSGFRLIPDVCYFYTLGTDSFSEVYLYTHNHETWQKQILCP